MKKYLLLIGLGMVCCNLFGCTSISEEKAPCNYYGTFCGQKIRINH